MAAMLKPVSAADTAVFSEALARAVVACRPADTARDGNDRRIDVVILNG